MLDVKSKVTLLCPLRQSHGTYQSCSCQATLNVIKQTDVRCELLCPLGTEELEYATFLTIQAKIKVLALPLHEMKHEILSILPPLRLSPLV